MHIKDILAIVLAILAVPFMFIGLIDPLEGGIALIIAVVLTAIAWALSQVRIPAIEWIPLVILWIYRAATLVAVVGSVIYAARIIHRIRHPETV